MGFEDGVVTLAEYQDWFKQQHMAQLEAARNDEFKSFKVAVCCLQNNQTGRQHAVGFVVEHGDGEGVEMVEDTIKTLQPYLKEHESLACLMIDVVVPERIESV